MKRAARRRKLAPRPRGRIKGWVRRLLVAILLLSVAAGFLATCWLVLLRWVDPPVTTVQIQRRIEAWVGEKPYRKQYVPVRLNEISVDLQHAVIAAEDGRFYDHRGIDFKELKTVVGENIEEGHFGRGASTLTQQLVKNLFLTTHRSFVRKGFEFALAPLAELILPKQRILELYLNVIEWGPGVYGAQAAARHHYGVNAGQLSREQAARLAACIPSPVARRPERMNEYSAEVLTRMQRMGW